MFFADQCFPLTCLVDLMDSLDALQEQCKQDDLFFLSIWLCNIQALFSDNFKRCRLDMVKVVPMMLDIAEVSLASIIVLLVHIIIYGCCSTVLALSIIMTRIMMLLFAVFCC